MLAIIEMRLLYAPALRIHYFQETGSLSALATVIVEIN
jgi:hypothetical protein